MPVLQRNEAILLQGLLLSQEVAECYEHDSIYHHLVKHAFAHFRLFLFVEEVDDRIETGHADHAEEGAVDEVLVVDVRLDDCVDATFCKGFPFYEDRVVENDVFVVVTHIYFLSFFYVFKI